MKQFFKMFFASMLAIVVTSVLVILLIVGIISAAVNRAGSNDEKTEVESNSVLKIDLNRRFHEQGEDNSFSSFSGESNFRPGIYDLRRTLEEAAKDGNIKGIYLDLSDCPNSWATLSQLRDALLVFRKSGKFVYGYGEQISQRAYFVASAANRIFLNPIGDLEFKGLSSELMFFKGALDKLEVKPEIYYAGKFKSATEPFRAEKMSEPNRLQIATLQHAIWSNFLTAVQEKTGTDTATLQQIANDGLVQFPADAIQYKLADQLAYADEVETAIRQQTKQGAKDKIKYLSEDDYAANFKINGSVKDNRIALLYAEGEIADGKRDAEYQIASEDFAKTIREIRDNDKIKAVVMRVNSPGGSALASEVILRELQLLKAKKPLIVSMGDVAASGGYYISAQADSIFVLPNTITGSIGVFSMLFEVEGLLKNKLGVTTDGVKNARYADFPSGTRPLTEEEGARMQRSVDNIYAIFKSRVLKGRRIEPAFLDSIAQGRVWSGADAIRLGLADRFGGIPEALAAASKKAGLSDYTISTYPDRMDRFENMIRRLKSGGVSAGVLRNAVQQDFGKEYAIYDQVSKLRRMQGKVQMSWPWMLEIK